MTFRKISSGDVIIRSSLIEVYDVLNREQFSASHCETSTAYQG
jgi:hypothetical protein